MSNSMADSSSREREGEAERKHTEQQHREKSLTPFQRLTYDLSHDERYIKEITLGKRIGFYRIRGELGSGNFCQVKMGIHSLTRGKNARRSKNIAWRLASHSLNLPATFACRQSCYQDLGQDKAGSENAAFAIKGNFFDGETPSSQYNQTL